MNELPVRFLWLMIPLVVWSLVWKGLALWTSARRGEKWWFVAFLFVNTAGLLEILYIYYFSRRTKPAAEPPKTMV